MSLRHRLPLTYGMIALLAALALGAALLLILRGYYGRQERAYLERNAAVVRNLIAGTSLDDEGLVEKQMRSLAFLTQTRIRVFDSADNLIVDTGVQSDFDAQLTLLLAVESDGVSQQFSQTLDGQQPSLASSETNVSVAIEGGEMTVSSSVRGQSADTETIATPWNFSFSATHDARSSHIVRIAFPGIVREYGGYAELSNGPAFGSAVVRSVAWGLVVAGIVAVTVAAAAGVLVARRITQPLLTLTAATERLEAGDLSARSEVVREDEIGRLSTTFNAMADRMTHTIATLRHFVADAAHEINTPLTALKTNLELAAQRPDEAQHLQQAQAQNERLIRLTRDLLQLSRLESDELPLERLPLELRQLLATRCEPFASRAEQRDITFSLSLPAERVCVNGDAVQLQRVVANLLDNALKFTPPGGEICVALRVVDYSAEIGFCDTGIGIDGDLTRIFDRFHRAPNAAAHVGSGLGLAIAQHVVRAHGGTIHVQSSKAGSQFQVRLPLAQPHG